MNCPEGVKLSLVGNKADLDRKRQVSLDMGKKLA
jgi:GTPase SAR1 family protein